MEHEDLEAIRADRVERAKQDATKKVVGKAKRCRPKATTQAYESKSGKKRGRKREGVAFEGVVDEQVKDASGPSTKVARIALNFSLPWSASVVLAMRASTGLM
jgi:hypothetical protein